jgi:hypothetical protein
VKTERRQLIRQDGDAACSPMNPEKQVEVE